MMSPDSRDYNKAVLSQKIVRCCCKFWPIQRVQAVVSFVWLQFGRNQYLVYGQSIATVTPSCPISEYYSFCSLNTTYPYPIPILPGMCGCSRWILLTTLRLPRAWTIFKVTQYTSTFTLGVVGVVRVLDADAHNTSRGPVPNFDEKPRFLSFKTK